LTRDGDTSIKMTSVRVLTTSSPPLFPSDHYPVVAQLQQTD